MSKATSDMLHSANAELEKARYVLFSANSNLAGHSHSARGQQPAALKKSCPNFIRQTDRLFPTVSASLKKPNLLADIGALKLPATKEEQIQKISDQTRQLQKLGKTPIVLGGDHLVKYAALKASIELQAAPGVLYIDAHPDTDLSNEIYFGSILTHAVKTLGYPPSNILILGLRQATTSEKAGLDELGICYIQASEFELNLTEDSISKIRDFFAPLSQLYISIDLDAFDPSVAPAVEAPYPGGITLLRTAKLIQELVSCKTIVGADISEFIVEQDPDHLTALLSCYLIKELTS